MEHLLAAAVREPAASDVVVAVIDTGVDYNHVDLRSNIWQDRQGGDHAGQRRMDPGFQHADPEDDGEQDIDQHAGTEKPDIGRRTGQLGALGLFSRA